MNMLGAGVRAFPEKTGCTQYNRPAKNQGTKLAVASGPRERAYGFKG